MNKIDREKEKDIFFTGNLVPISQPHYAPHKETRICRQELERKSHYRHIKGTQYQIIL